MNNLDKLKKIMLENKLSVKDIALMVGIRPKNVYAWFADKSKRWSRSLSDQYISLIEYKIKEKGKL